jgi:hypothetical protein
MGRQAEKEKRPLSQAELRGLIRNSINRPIRICMDDGKTYVVAHPDFALAGPDAVVLVSGPGHDFGASFVICWFEHLFRVEVLNQAKPT